MAGSKVRWNPKTIEQTKRGALKTVKAKAERAIRAARCPDHGKTAQFSHYNPNTGDVLVVGCCTKGVEAAMAAIRRALK